MSDSEDSTVTYTTVSSPYEGRSGDVSPGVDGPLVMPEDPYAYVVSCFRPYLHWTTCLAPRSQSRHHPHPFTYLMYRSRCTQSPEEDDDEDLEEDPADYPADHDDEKEEEPSGDDADEEDEEQDEDDDDEEEEHPASVDSIPPPPTLRVTASISFRPQPSTLADRPEVTLPPRKRLSIVHCLEYEAGESLVAAAARPIEGRRADYGFVDSVEAEIRRRRAEDIGYEIDHDSWLESFDFDELDLAYDLRMKYFSRKGNVENSFTRASTEAIENVKIVQSYNSLLLCTGPGRPACNDVYNPSTNLFKMLSPLDYSHADSPFYMSVGLRRAFDPTKSLNYKVVHVGRTSFYINIQTYCSKIGNRKLCRDWFNFFSFNHFESAIYWNGALHWLETKDILDGYRKLFESRGCLLAVLRDYIGSREFTIYEMRKWCSVWSFRYLVNTDDFMNPLPERWSIWSIVWSIVLEEREEDSCLVINLSRKVVKYNLISKTLYEIYDIGSNQHDDDELIPPFVPDHNIYQFIMSFASV
nr:hypothetical protein [Tanacetum cinerariifolium]